MIRDDLSDKLIHFTKYSPGINPEATFKSIVQQKRLLGGNGMVKGSYRCICFSEAPVNKFAQLLACSTQHGVRYAPWGVMVKKKWLFNLGGRPVIYQPDAEYELLHETHKFRHVRYEPEKDVDFSWEREWRLHANEIILPPEDVTLVVPTRSCVEQYKMEHARRIDDVRFMGSTAALYGIHPLEWHFLVLEDLGVTLT